MLRTAGSGPFLLVEGNTEYQFLSAHVASDIDLIDCRGCENLEKAKMISSARSESDVAALRDRDWYGVLTPEPTDPTLFLTEFYDLDATIILGTDAGRRVAEVFADSDALADWLRRHPEHSVISVAVALAGAVGRLRLASERHALGIRSERTPLAHPVVDADCAEVDISEMVVVAISRSGHVQHSRDHVHSCVKAEYANGHADERLCCGHDLGNAFAALIAGPWSGTAHNGKFILKAIRAALSRAEFSVLSFVAPIERWAASHGASAWR